MALTYRSTGAWGSGIGVDLTAAQVDANFYDLDQRVVDLIANPPAVNQIETIAVSASELMWTITMTDASEFEVPVQQLVNRWRGAWAPFTIMAPLDTFVVEGEGAFMVLLSHTTVATFDPLREIAAERVYTKLWGFEPSGDIGIIYDLIIPYQGRLSDLTLPIVIPALHPILIPTAGAHIAFLGEAPSTADQVVPLFHNATQIGTATWLIGNQLGTVTFTVDTEIAADEYFSIGLPLAPDATAAGMSLAIAAQRVIP